MTEAMGVAISTTGDEHRLALLAQSAQAWWRALAAHGLPTTVLVTVDGDEAATARVVEAVLGFAEVYRVGQRRWGVDPFDGKQGVAVNKNTGIEALMDRGVEHLFLSDDDTWPLFAQSLDKHTGLAIPHTMVCWGKHRLDPASHGDHAEWTWPRGVMVYTHRTVIEQVGGLVEAFGPGGHEHVEWSQRIHNAGLTPAPFCSPAVYALQGATGLATRASTLWHAEDMPKRGERSWQTRQRREALTSVKRRAEDWKSIDAVMARQQGSSAYVPYHAVHNGRVSATLCTAPSRGAGGEK